MTNAIHAPVHTANYQAATLRFFKAPLPGLHVLWHSHDDLVRCLGLPRDLRRVFREKIHNDPAYRSDVRTVATSDGITTIAPHFMAQGLIGSMVEMKVAPASAEIDYSRALMEAWQAVHGDLPIGVALENMLRAIRNSNGGEPGGAA